MWTRIVVTVSAISLLIGCGNSVDEAGDNPGSIQDTTKTHADRGPYQPIGYLSKPSSNANVAAIEDRLSVYLKGDLSRINFAEGTAPYLQSAGRSNPPLNLNVRGFKSPRGLTLVIRHLERVTTSELSGLSMDPCEIGSLYTGYAAANQSLYFYIDTESGPKWDWAIPYGLVICDMGKDFDVLALPVNHVIFTGDAKKMEALRALRKNHPLHGAF